MNDASSAWLFFCVNGQRHAAHVDDFLYDRTLCVRRPGA